MRIVRVPFIVIYIHKLQIDCLSCAFSCALLFFCLSSPIFLSGFIAVIVSLYALEPFSFEERALGSCEKLLTFSFCCFFWLLETLLLLSTFTKLCLYKCGWKAVALLLVSCEIHKLLS